MPFIKEDLDDVHEGEAVPEGEYELRIVRAEEAQSRNSGRNMLVASIKIENAGIPNASLVREYLMDPSDAPDQEQAYRDKLKFKRFCNAFSLPLDCEVEDMVGATAEMFVEQDPSDDDPDVVYNRLRLPRLARGQ